MRLKSVAISVAAVAAVLTSAGPAFAAELPAPPSAAVAASTGVEQEDDPVAEHFENATPFREAGDARTEAAQQVVITEVQEGVRNPNKLAECYQAQGGTCVISQAFTLTATISSSVGLDFEVLNAELGGSYSESLTVTTGCTNVVPARTYLRAYPSGDFVFFTVDGQRGTAFLPTGIQCQIEE